VDGLKTSLAWAHWYLNESRIFKYFENDSTTVTSCWSTQWLTNVHRIKSKLLLWSLKPCIFWSPPTSLTSFLWFLALYFLSVPLYPISVPPLSKLYPVLGILISKIIPPCHHSISVHKPSPFFSGGGCNGVELRTLCLQGRCSTTSTTPQTLYALLINEIGSFFMPRHPGPWFSCLCFPA
jgi:hypothetical protein